MTLSQLVERLGRVELARRAGVTPATVGRWLSKGPSRAGAEIIRAVLRRHETSTKAAATRRRSAQASTGIEVPQESELPSEKVLPTKLPGDAREVKAAKRAEGIGAGTKQQIDSIYNIGDIEWFTIGRPVSDVSESEIADLAVKAWQDSGRDYVQVKFLFFRYIPFNPLYRGELIKKQGTWVEWWAQTNAQSAINSITRNIEYVMDLSYKAAETRVIFLEMIGVATFDHRSHLEITRPLGRR